MLEPLFGAGAFDQHGHRLSRFLDGPSPTAARYDDLWYHISQAYGHHMGAPPTDGSLASARGQLGADGSQKLQHRLTVQLEDAAYHSLDDQLRSLPHCQIRHAWLQLDALSQQWVTSWPSVEHAIAPVEFSEVMATYLGVESPLVRGRVGEHIPDGPTSHRVCDAYGIQLALATLPGRSFDDHTMTSWAPSTSSV